MIAAGFDAAAASYDRTFTDRPLARWLRSRVWEVLDRVFSPGETILELGCGTGEDAVHLARRGLWVHALDSSSKMLAEARAKARAASVEDRIELRQADLEDLPTDVSAQRPVDGALSNFGALNCLSDLRPLGQTLANVVRPGGRVIVVLMGPFCPLEISLLVLRGRPRSALRRLRRGAEASVGGGGRLRVWYPSPRRAVRQLGPDFRPRGIRALGLLLPPPALGSALESSPGIVAALQRGERLVADWGPASWLSDHYLLDLERLP